MSLRELNPATRRMLRRHGWLLTLWCVGLGWATTWALLHLAHVEHPMPRYAATAAVMYWIGLLGGVRFWLRHLRRQVDAEPGRFGRASPGEKLGYDEDINGRSVRRARAGDSFQLADLFGDIAGALDELSLLVWIPALLLFLLGLVLSATAMPALLVDGLAVLLAEVAVQFLFGSVAARRLLRAGHLDEDQAWGEMLRRTWVAGVVFVAVAAAAGALLHRLAPELRSVGELLRSLIA